MKTRALSRLAAVVVIGCSVGAAHAQEPSKAAIAAAREVIIAKGGALMFIPLLHGVIESVKQSFLPTNPNLARELNDVAQIIHKDLDAKRSEPLDEVATIYARHFTEQELSDLVVFYKTPLGQKWAREEPAAIEEGLHRVKEWTDSFSQVVLGRFRTEMQKKGHQL
jgi:uncharacterized protein